MSIIYIYMLGEISPHAYLQFLKAKKVIPKTVVLVMGTLISSIVKKMIKDFIYPLSKGRINKVKKRLLNAHKLYGALLINVIITTYLLFVISSFFD